MTLEGMKIPCQYEPPALIVFIASLASTLYRAPRITSFVIFELGRKESIFENESNCYYETGPPGCAAAKRETDAFAEG